MITIETVTMQERERPFPSLLGGAQIAVCELHCRNASCNANGAFYIAFH